MLKTTRRQAARTCPIQIESALPQDISNEARRCMIAKRHLLSRISAHNRSRALLPIDLPTYPHILRHRKNFPTPVVLLKQNGTLARHITARVNLRHGMVAALPRIRLGKRQIIGKNTKENKG
jgi:hypothetical protein